jgi:hypothetical protein
MAEPTPQQIFTSIQSLTTHLVHSRLVDDQEWPRISTSGGSVEISTQNRVNSSVLKNVPYSAMYAEQARSRSFNFVLLDKALVQMSYEFEVGRLIRHRLAFLPSPSLLDFQADPDFYLNEVLYADIVGHQVVAVPIRIDFDVRNNVEVGRDHAAAHMTLGQYRHCRIPLSAPVTPGVFVDFLVRHFYRTPDMPEFAIDRELDRAFAVVDPPIDADLVHVFSPGNR